MTTVTDMGNTSDWLKTVWATVVHLPPISTKFTTEHPGLIPTYCPDWACHVDL